jgi:isopentenyl phosphate kinase
MQGVHNADQWRGFAQVATVASQLSQLVANTLHQEGVPAWRLQPSASALSHDGVITRLEVAPIAAALDHGIVPLVHGDVALDDVRGGTIISTETIFFYLATRLPVSQILLLGEVEGVYDARGDIIPTITPANFAAIEDALGGSAGTDVTGGMETKVRDMLALVESMPRLTIRIMNGTRPGLLQQTLGGTADSGTVIRADYASR